MGGRAADDGTEMKKALPWVAVPVALVLFCCSQGHAQSSGEQAFDRECRTCHDGSLASRAPAPEMLKARSPHSILAALSAGGAMQRPGAKLSADERRGVVQFLTGRALEGDVTGTAEGRCEKQETFTVLRTAGRPLPRKSNRRLYAGSRGYGIAEEA